MLKKTAFFLATIVSVIMATPSYAGRDCFTTIWTITENDENIFTFFAIKRHLNHLKEEKRHKRMCKPALTNGSRKKEIQRINSEINSQRKEYDRLCSKIDKTIRRIKNASIED